MRRGAATIGDVELRWAADASQGRLVATTGEGSAEIQLDALDTRLRVGLCCSARSNPVDISIQPEVVRLVVQSPVAQPTHTQAALDLVRDWIADFCVDNGLWLPANRADLLRVLTGAAFPMLSASYDRGALTLAEVPAWAGPVLVETTARAAATAALGSSATRAVVRAFASSLIPRAPAPAPLFPLAIGLMVAELVPPDAIARILDAASNMAPSETARLPTTEDIKRFRRITPELGPARVERILVDAAQISGGADLLLRTSMYLDQLPSGVKADFPRGLVRLHARCRDLMPVDPNPEGIGRGTSRTPVIRVRRTVTPRPRVAPRSADPRRTAVEAPPGPTAPPMPAVPCRALRPPIENERRPASNTPLHYQAATQALHGLSVGGRLQLVLPRTTSEVATWGHRLENCLGSFAGSAAAGRSLLIGVMCDDAVAYCLELEPATRTIRQFLGRRNRPVPRSFAAAVCKVLLASAHVSPTHPANAPWLALCS